MNDDRARRCARLRWLCRRGMKELDILLERFCRDHLDQLDDAGLTDFESLLQLEDPDLYAVLIGGGLLSDAGPNALANTINDRRHPT